jgi:hypothetical protein
VTGQLRKHQDDSHFSHNFALPGFGRRSGGDDSFHLIPKPVVAKLIKKESLEAAQRRDKAKNQKPVAPRNGVQQ